MEPVLHFQIWQLILIGFVTLWLTGTLKKIIGGVFIVLALGLAFGMFHLQGQPPFVKISTPTVAAPSADKPSGESPTAQR